MMCNPTCNHRVSTDRAAQGAEFLSLGWWGSIVYITSSRRTVQLGWMQGVYERFPLQKLIRYTPATQAGLYRGGPLYLYLLYACNPGKGDSDWSAGGLCSRYRLVFFQGGTVDYETGSYGKC